MRNWMPPQANSVKNIARKMAGMLGLNGRPAGRGEAELPRSLAIASNASSGKT